MCHRRFVAFALGLGVLCSHAAGAAAGRRSPSPLSRQVQASQATQEAKPGPYRAELDAIDQLNSSGRAAEAVEASRKLLARVELDHRTNHRVAELSGGEQQRVSIARALANRPPVILADEPTAPLDSERALAVVRILNQMAQQYQTAIIVVTHDEKIIPTFRRLYHIRDGRTVEEPGYTSATG